MRIGFDAKRAYHNTTGLGYYSRTLIGLLQRFYPMHEYFLFNPKPATSFSFSGSNIHEIRPGKTLHKLFSSAWRSSWVKKDLEKLNIELYHGLSHEIPLGIEQTRTRSVVTIHDLIHERYPEQYNAIDVKIYHKKFLYACRNANRVVAISQQTKNDIIEFYKIDPAKIDVCYQSCDPVFAERIPEEEKKRLRLKYGLPPSFFLYVGSIIERKNLLNICKAIYLLRDEWSIPLLVVGKGGKYEQVVKDYIRQHDLNERVIFLSHSPLTGNDAEFRTPRAFAALYQSAIAMIYPSFFEGFGAPVLEALWSRLPVITSDRSCLPEVGGDAAYYVDPTQAEQIAEGMKKIVYDPGFAESMREKGWLHAQRSSPPIYARNMMNIYEHTLRS